ncbi:hypothetical protein N7468_005326 [Penicillium chermesinum]|uniref:Uncharacterized protein n=1 Tax=Penicillium chermesinum TaxID=63820 RepID=A0A9W9NZ76_9EURO|nr:uncharacterized protein N7468_005326 [Penicillium chermesinum]KAJ5232370.1 hypothetical protein N7468_005326 [Penicillium chermesinum]KAJ6172029.1 hypothetical protein N7470_001096 [Penicillium chermesinum]
MIASPSPEELRIPWPNSAVPVPLLAVPHSPQCQSTASTRNPGEKHRETRAYYWEEGCGGACCAAIYALWTWIGGEQDLSSESTRGGTESDYGFVPGPRLGAALVRDGSVKEAVALETILVVVGTVPDFAPWEEEGDPSKEDRVVHGKREEKRVILEMYYHPKPPFYILGEEAGQEVLFETESIIWQSMAQ